MLYVAKVKGQSSEINSVDMNGNNKGINQDNR